MTRKKSNGLYIMKAEIEKFKNIDSRVLEIDGRSFILVGKNGAGKSSIFQAMLCGIDAEYIPTEPIAIGEKKATTTVVLAGIVDGEEKEYTLTVYFTPGKKSGRLVITDKDGTDMKLSRKAFQDIIQYKSFDIYSFLRKTKAEKIKELKIISGVGVAIDKIDMERKEIYDKRTKANAVIESDENTLKSHGMTQEEIELYSKPVDIEPIEKELETISQKIDRVSAFKSKVDGLKKERDDLDTETAKRSKRLLEIKEEMDALVKEQENIIADEYLCIEKIDGLQEKIRIGDIWLADPKNQPPSATEISKRLSDANAHNKKCEQVDELGKKQIALTAKKQAALQLTADIEALDDKKSNLIKNSKLPIPNFTFDENEIYLNKLPLDESQHNTQAMLDVSIRISRALNPVLKVVYISEGSLYDKEHLNVILKENDEAGYMTIIEMVDPDGGDLEMKFTETEF